MAVVAATFPSLGWMTLVGGYGGRVGFVASLKVYALSQGGKYLPGKLWAVAGRVVLAEQYGVSRRIGALATTTEMVVAGVTAGAVAVGLGGALLPAGRGTLLWTGICAVGVAFGLAFPGVLLRGANALLRVLRRAPLEAIPSRASVACAAGWYALSWGVFGCGFFLLAGPVGGLTLAQLPAATAAFAWSWILGCVALFAPAGLGVREVTLAVLLAKLVPEPAAIALALLSRVWLTTADVLLVLVGLALPARRVGGRGDPVGDGRGVETANGRPSDEVTGRRRGWRTNSDEQRPTRNALRSLPRGRGA